MIFWTRIPIKMIFWRFPKSVSVLYNYIQLRISFLRPACSSQRQFAPIAAHPSSPQPCSSCSEQRAQRHISGLAGSSQFQTTAGSCSANCAQVSSLQPSMSCSEQRAHQHPIQSWHLHLADQSSPPMVAQASSPQPCSSCSEQRLHQQPCSSHLQLLDQSSPPSAAQASSLQPCISCSEQREQ